jgi:phosphohistidine swiveling domain-containing protein
MPKKSLVFHKNFIRDTIMILQQLWPLSMEEGLGEIVPKNPHRPSVVDYLRNGSCEIWENDAAVNYIKDQFTKFSLSKPREALRFLDRFEEKNKPLEKIWRRGVLGSLKELKDFIALVSDNMPGDLFILYISDEDRVKGAVKERAHSLRDGDHYFSSSNKVFVNTVKKLFPKIKDYANAVRCEDLDKMPSLIEMKRRYKNYIWTSGGYNKVQTLEAYAKKTGYRFVTEKVDRSQDSLKGQTACAGRVTGRVRLLYTTKDLAKVRKGDIVVSPMTTANFMPALKKAAAFVTDEGGIACHAAIVARELKKPCLIATKIATKVFKENDLVEVDTYTGMVRKLNRK